MKTAELQATGASELDGGAPLTVLKKGCAVQHAFEAATRSDTTTKNSHRPRAIRIGLLGLGTVGQAVARLSTSALPAFVRHGLRPIINSALVRDGSKTRDRGPNVFLVTRDPEVFFRQRLDVIIEVLGGIEPARSYIERSLAAGTPVVTANKSVLAAHGPALADLARCHGTELACEASAVAGVPFLTLLKRRPCCGDITRIVGILNGTSNFVLSRIAEMGCTLDTALREAQHCGFAEPDPACDLNGRDAAEKLIVILQHLGIRGVRLDDIETRGLSDIGPADLARAATLGGAIKPVAYAEIDNNRIATFVGPAFVASGSPLHDVDRVDNAICLSGPHVGPLVLRGPGAGPDITAATLLDDVAELIATRRSDSSHFHKSQAEVATWWKVVTPPTRWFLRCVLSDTTPFQQVADCLKSHGIETAGLVGAPSGHAERSVYLTTRQTSRRELEAALHVLKEKLRCTVLPLRILPS